MSESGAGANEIPTCHGGLENLDEEHDYWIDEVEGELPSDLQGTFFRNGPGRQKIGGTPYGHWFDGDGMLSRFTFTGDRVHFRNRYVRTPKYVRETAANAIVCRGFGTQIPGGFLRNVGKMPANPANTNTIVHGGYLLALNEGGKPFALEPDSLETIGEFTYDGELEPSMMFSAHGKVHPGTGDYINFGAGIAGFGLKGPKTCLNLFRINSEGRLYRKGQIALDAFPFCHDFALTDKYAIFFLGSIVFGGMGSVLAGLKTISDVVSFDAHIPMQAVVVDLDTLTEVRRFETQPGAIIHFGNAFEAGDEIVIDAMFADNFEANKTLADVFHPDARFNGGQYRRYRLDMKTGELGFEQVVGAECEFPTFNPAVAGKQHGVTYVACSVANGSNSFFNGVGRVTFDGDAQIETLEPGLYGSEPLYAPRQGSRAEGDGYLLEVVYDGLTHRSEVQILRAETLEQVCRLRLPHHLPHQFHGYFTSAVFV